MNVHPALASMPVFVWMVWGHFHVTALLGLQGPIVKLTSMSVHCLRVSMVPALIKSMDSSATARQAMQASNVITISKNAYPTLAIMEEAV